MVQLIRLLQPAFTTSSSNASWSNRLLEPAYLKKDSRIAISSISIPITQTITITDANNKFDFRCKATDNFTKGTLTNGRYQMQEFIDAINQQFVDNLTFDVASQIGFYMKLIPTVQGYGTLANLYFNRTKLTSFDNPEMSKITQNAGAYTVNGSSAPIGSCYAVDKSLFQINGTSIYSIEVSIVGALMCFITSDDIISPIQTDTMDYYINVNPAGTYVYLNKATGVEVDSNIACVADDTIDIQLNKGFIRYVVYDDAGNEKFLFQNTVKLDLSLFYRAGVILAADNTKVMIPQITSSPDYSLSSDEKSLTYDLSNFVNTIDVDVRDTELSVIPVPPVATNTKFTMKFSPTLNTILGFRSNTLEKTGSSGIFTAYNPIYQIVAKNLVITSPSFAALMCYDTNIGYQRRRPILGCFSCVATDQGSVININYPNPIFLDLKFAQDSFLNNIQIEIYTDSDDDPTSANPTGENIISVNDQCQIVLLID